MLKLNNICDNASTKKSKRIGRGIGSGKGKTSGAGHKGQKARSGVAIKGFEGGQMPLHRRLPKRGFKNPFKKKYSIINLETLQKAIDRKQIDVKKEIDVIALYSAGLVRNKKSKVKLLGHGKVTSPLNLKVDMISKKALSLVEKAKGSVILHLNKEKEKEINGVKKPAKKIAKEKKPDNKQSKAKE